MSQTIAPNPLPDPLAGLSTRQRLQRERDDVAYIMTSGVTAMITGNPARFVGTALEALQPYNGGAVEAAICARIDLDHPLYFSSNVMADCVDCGCNLQVRPDCPPGPRVCICCAARRAREELEGR